MVWFLYDRDLRHEKFNKDQPKEFRTKYNYVRYKYTIPFVILKAFILVSFLSFQLFHADKKVLFKDIFWVFRRHIGKALDPKSALKTLSFSTRNSQLMPNGLNCKFLDYTWGSC